MTEADKPPLTYAGVGIDFDARQGLVAGFKEAAKRASRPEVLSGIGPFAGLFALGSKYRDPVIVASADGLGTKGKVGALVGRYESLGHDIVNHCINDAFTTGAEPLFFLDAISSSDFASEAKLQLVTGIANACAAAGCALLGGETADTPGVYAPGDFDLVGFIVGAVDRAGVIDGSRIVPGDLLFALPSNGLHTNGYSLARAAFDVGLDPINAARDRERLKRYEESLGETLADALLRPHRPYVADLKPALSLIKGMAHITGGGLEENVPRVLPANVGARFDRGAWSVPPIFRLIQQTGGIEDEEMARVFNMGLGMVFAIDPLDADRLQALVPEALPVGEIVSQVAGEPRVGWR